MLAKRNPAARLVLAGHARDSRHVRALIDQARRLGVGSRVEVRTDVDRAELTRLYGKASAIVHPALFEPFGLALLEGMAQGCAAISSSSEYAGGWVDILERGRQGLGFANPDELTSAMARTLADGPEALDLRKRAAERAELFSRARLTNGLRPHFH
jgi:glycosyltransferase involved in cell wall biosynthesis